jgi:hypothetical protein
MATEPESTDSRGAEASTPIGGPGLETVLDRARELAGAWLAGLAERPVGARGEAAGLGGPLPAAGEDPVAVLERLAAAAEPRLVGSPGPRY